MPPAPIITFKAGICEVEDSSRPMKVLPKPEPGYLYLYKEDDLPHFCWRRRAAPLADPTLDLIMFPGDGTFKPFEQKTSDGKPAVNGRVFVLRFSSSSARHFFWLQSKSQHPTGDPSWFSQRDQKIGEIVNLLLQGEEVNVQREIANLPTSGGDGGNDDDDTAMEDADGGQFGADHHRAASGGAGADATGGDIREEGEESREGGADGGRAAASSAPGNAETQAAVANFLKSLQGSNFRPQQAVDKPYITLSDLLQPSTTIQALTSPSSTATNPSSNDDDEDDTHLNVLLSHLPPTLILLAAGSSPNDLSSFPSDAPIDAETLEGITLSLRREQKIEILAKVLRSPQFSQSLASLTMALRDGGLPSIAEALGIKVENGGMVKGGNVPLGGGEAVEAFVEGIKKQVQDEDSEKREGGERMDTD